MKLKDKPVKLGRYFSNRFPNGIKQVDYVDVYSGDMFLGMYSASLALKGKYLALDPMNRQGKAASYCFPMDTLVFINGGQINFNYCGADFELAMFREDEEE